MWKSFLSSIGLLAIAMLAALYSSSAGRDGRVAAAGISALLALGIAVWVAIRFVPRLASHVDWEWLPFLSHYHVTREGWMYFAAITVVIFAAINTANNLLYMVLSSLLAVLMLSGFLSALNFRLLKVEVRIPTHCFAGAPFPISIQVHNQKHIFPTFSMHFEPPDKSAVRFSSFYIPVVGRFASSSQAGQAMLKTRGEFRILEIKASSKYPFGFFLKQRPYPVDARCICYPEIQPVETLNLSFLDLQGENQRFERGLGHDLYMIRDYVPSDSARHVHWKASAKTSALKTREYAADESNRVILVFDRYGRPGDTVRFEQLVSNAATLAFHLINAGFEFSFISDDWRSGHGNPQTVLASILEYLALVQMSALADPPSTEKGFRLSLRN